MGTKRVTINDVAAAAGVSRQTVTRAMNAMAEITPATREKVLRVSEELGYRPSRFASNLARQKHHSLGLVVGTLRNPYYTDLAADVLDVAAAEGWQILMATSEGSSGPEVVARLAPQVDAIAGYFEEPEESVVRAARRVPVVLIERPTTMPGAHSVLLDFREGMARLIDDLRRQGSRRFAMIDSERTGPPYRPTPRREVFEEFAGRSGVPVETAPETIEGAAHAFVRLRGVAPDVDTVIVFNDLMAMGALQSAHALGLAVPDDVRVVGIDGLSLGAVTYPPLTSLSIDRHAIAVAALDIARRCLSDESPGQITRVVTPHLLRRESA
ncbi:LacI family DNA-binding transcriptional regulator [Streptomyces sp. NBRC 109706]|uniref:LacI family DNA-binding transcriptional regulator n=1 Tax=Streptomyces sp. NBRC 109706 TaxID=1550035 RepID=UPI0007847C9E|nr:LacI family DNA-binding transcriptional regulator [Streptomyces sp. NBRC 109706]